MHIYVSVDRKKDKRILIQFLFTELQKDTYQQFSAALAAPAKAWTKPGPETTKQTAGLKIITSQNWSIYIMSSVVFFGFFLGCFCKNQCSISSHIVK